MSSTVTQHHLNDSTLIKLFILSFAQTDELHGSITEQCLPLLRFHFIATHNCFKNKTRKLHNAKDFVDEWSQCIRLQPAESHINGLHFNNATLHFNILQTLPVNKQDTGTQTSILFSTFQKNSKFNKTNGIMEIMYLINYI